MLSILALFTTLGSGAWGGECILYSFTGGSDGGNPYGSLVSSGTVLYGTTVYGGIFDGSESYGTVFTVSTNGTGFATLHCFDYPDGANPYALNPA
jgi:hypothetical protein